MPPLRLKLSLFPSPIGELHFSIVRNTLGEIRFRVSVPYRGATFLNQVVLLAVILICSISVPYRGATFLNFFPKFYKTLSAKFPSPIGELHFSILRAFICWQSVHQVSVPYRGATFLNNLRILLGRLNSVSVPYRGATFLNVKDLL